MDSFEQLDVAAVKLLIGGKDVTVVDIRDEDSYKAEHIPGAISLNDGNLESFLRAADKDKPLICYCYHGISSQSAANYFSGQGFAKVYSMIGGFEEWRNQV
ncbi:MAG: thiosulfate sulfurtransferase GlpE [Candidatus Omnitrophica bacterium]|nr:thiosulfate sulfurtransferase GlpE [Candidatus Omnitrophota bacterium]